MLTEAEVIRIMREHLEGQFPRTCSVCHRRFATLRDYAVTTQPVGIPICFDAEVENWHPVSSTGAMTYNQCPCGNIMALNSNGMPLALYKSLLGWARQKMENQNVTHRQLLIELREKMIQEVLGDPSRPVR